MVVHCGLILRFWDDKIRNFVKIYPCLSNSQTNFVTLINTHYGNNQHTQRKLLNFENWVSGEVSKSAKSHNLLTFKVNYLYQKLSESFSICFSLKFFVNDIFWSILKSLSLLKWCPIFNTSPLTQFSKFNNFLWVFFILKFY